MLKTYKNYFYKGGSAYKEIDPVEPIKNGATQVFLAEKPTGAKIEQVRFGIDYQKDDMDVNISLRTFHAGSSSATKESQPNLTETVWITLQLPNNKHIDWILSNRCIRWEYYLEGYGYTNYLFAEIYKGSAPAYIVPKEYNIKDKRTIWIYESTSNRKKQRRDIVTDQAGELKTVFDLTTELLETCDKFNVKMNSSVEEISHLVNNSKCLYLLDQLIMLIHNYDIKSQPIFATIHEMQCDVQGVEDMFKVDKLWDKKGAVKDDSIKVSHIKKN